MSRAPITTHILNLDNGKPAAGVLVYLYEPENTTPIAMGKTDSDGRIAEWDKVFSLRTGIYRLQFSVGDWFAQQDRPSFYPEVQIPFNVLSTNEHFHVPLLLNAHGYSTYRGS